MADSPDETLADLTAYLDGELDSESAAALEEKLRRDPALRKEAEALQRTWNLLDFLPQPEPSANFTSRTLDKLEIVKPAPAANRSAATPAPSRSPWMSRLTLAAAAVALFLVGLALPGPFLQQGQPSLSREEAELQIARDLRVLENLPQYQLGENLDFLYGLNDPDLFGN